MIPLGFTLGFISSFFFGIHKEFCHHDFLRIHNMNLEGILFHDEFMMKGFLMIPKFTLFSSGKGILSESGLVTRCIYPKENLLRRMYIHRYMVYSWICTPN